MTAQTISPTALRQVITDGDELAVVDVREQGRFAENHLLLAVNIPLSRLEIDIHDLVPRLGTRLFLCDEGDGLAVRAARVLSEIGYTEMSALDGGIGAWKQAGFELFSGMNVPSKVFGEYIEHHYKTPHITALELEAMREAGDDLVVLDSRPMDEYINMNIPDGVNVPGAELVYRIRDLAADPQTTIVVNCAGRTRSIIGAQSLINAGVPNRVVDLQNGTMGWHLSGFELEYGSERSYGAVSPGAIEWSKDAAIRVGAKFGVRCADANRVRNWQTDDDRTLYIFDVRSPAEFAAEHTDGVRSAPGGQLIQTTDRYMATRNARIVLTDNDGIRATMTASWLIQMGWEEVFVFEDTSVLPVMKRQSAEGDALPENSQTLIAPLEAKQKLDAGNAIAIDLSNSRTFEAGHVPGAWWAMRSALEEALERIPNAETYILYGTDDRLAHLGAADLKSLSNAHILVMSGGAEAWKNCDLDLEKGLTNPASEVCDLFYKPYERKHGVDEAMKQYLSWETDLVEQVRRDGTLTFPRF